MVFLFDPGPVLAQLLCDRDTAVHGFKPGSKRGTKSTSCFPVLPVWAGNRQIHRQLINLLSICFF